MEWRIDGKVVYEHWSTETTTGEPVSTELIFDGDSTIYERFPPYEQYSMPKTDRPDNEDVGSHDFLFGRATLCPDAEALNAEYVETDETGKNYQVKGEKDFTVYWTDEDGWLVWAEGAFSTSDTAVAVLVVSGIGEDNAIPTPQPPYRKDPYR